MAQSSARKGDIPAAERYYAEGIRAQPTAERLYTELGKLLFENGAQERAARVFMSFPGLKNPAEMNPVGLANYAYVAGSLYYWSGDFARALPLYKVAAKLHTGSDSSQASEIRLALLNGDYVGALQGSLGRARQYNSSYAYRDYFGLVHAMGYSKEAWEGFTDLVRQTNEPYIWETALVGHRMQGATEAEVAKWLAQEPMRSAHGPNPYEPNYAPMYMLRFGVTDRMPSPELPALIAGLEPEEKGKTKGKSSLVYYAEAYASIRSGKFEAARAMFEEASAAHVMEDYLLPAYAYAAGRAIRNASTITSQGRSSPQSAASATNPCSI